MNSVWRDIPGFPYYQATDGGRCRRLMRSNRNLGRTKELKPDTDKRGRSRFSLRRNNKTVKLLASRMILLTFVGPCPEGLECCHENGDETDNRLGNLRWDTHSANLLDRRRHGTAVCGEMVHTAKMTADGVVEMRQLRQAGWSLKMLSQHFGVTEAMASYICRRKNWQHIPEVV